MIRMRVTNVNNFMRGQLCKVPLPVSLMVHNVLRSVGEYCESVPLNRTGSYILSASI